MKKLTVKQIKRINWKNNVRFYFEGTTLSELKAAINTFKEKEDRDYDEWLIRTSSDYKDSITNFLY